MTIAVVCGLILSSTAAAAGASADPWSQAPPLPTACYSSQDPEPVPDEAIESLQQQRQRHEEINQRSSDALNALDMSEQQNRMIAFLSSNPEAAIDSRVGPLREEHSKVPYGKGMTAADQARGQALIKRGNAAYETLCSEWFSAAGPFHQWLRRFREHLTEEWIPRIEEMNSSRKLNFEVMAIPAAEYRSTAALEGVVEYLRMADAVLRNRWDKPWHAI